MDFQSSVAEHHWFRALRNSVGVGSFLLIAPSYGIAASTDWRSTNQTLGAGRYIQLNQITPANVTNLREAWVYHMKPPTDTSPRFAASEAVPLVIGDRMYLPTPYGRIVALSATTGVEIWSSPVPDGDRSSLRGVSYWPGDGKQGPAVIYATRDGKLRSLNAVTGADNRAFGVDGVVNLKTPEVMQTGIEKSYTQPSPPLVFRNLVITGAGTGEGGGTGEGPAGDTRAWDARTGALVWTFHSVPRPGEVGHETWSGDSWKQRSGVNAWGYMTADEERGILYMSFGAPNNDRFGGDRPGDNLFGSSVVAVEATTGKYLWHFQVVHHDIWDFDAESPPTLADIHQGKQIIPAVIIVNKNALMFVLNRVTGKPIFPIELRQVPPSQVPGEHASPVQPFPVVTEPLSQNTLSRDNLYKGTPDHKAWCEKLVDENNMLLADRPYTPPTPDRYMVGLPGTHGGVNYYGGSVDPKQRLFVVNVNNLAQPMQMIRQPDGSYQNVGPLAGVRRFWNPETRLPCGPTPWGQMVAVSLDTGKVVWRSTLGVTDQLPEGKRDTGRPGLGGATTTAGNLTFVGATDDSRFRAFETSTGREVWTHKLPASANATPISYRGADGFQYVAVVATGGSLLGSKLEADTLVAFKLDTPAPASAVAPTLTRMSARTSSQPPRRPTSSEEATLQRSPAKAIPSAIAVVASAPQPAESSEALVKRVCSGCHESAIVTTQRLTPPAWRELVNQMIGRGAVATDADAARIAEYLARTYPAK